MQAHADRVPVLIIGNFLSGATGSRGVCEDLAAKLEQAGHKVFTASSFRSRFRRLSDMLASTWKHHRQYRVALVDVYSGASFLWAEAVAAQLSLLQKPFLLTLHGGNLPEFAAKNGARVARLLGAAASVTAPSAYLQRSMSQFRPDIQVIPNPLSLQAYSYRERNGCGKNILWLRAFHEIYNPTLAVRALARLRSDDAIQLTMVGADKGDGSLQRVMHEAKSLQLESRLSLPGAVPKHRVPEWLNSADIFINTTSIDNTPVSVLEAMAAGLCVISTNVGGIPYLLEHEVDSLLVPPNDPEALASAIDRVLNTPALAARLSRNAQVKAAKSDWSRVLPAWQQLFLQAVNRRSLLIAS
jgi:glycosyltransferase involved in cell wall biosynthesis